ARVGAAEAVVLDGRPGAADIGAEIDPGPGEGDRRHDVDGGEVGGHRVDALGGEGATGKEKPAHRRGTLPGACGHSSGPQNVPRTPVYMASGIPGRNVRGSLRTKKFGLPKVLLLKPPVSAKVPAE